MKSDQELRELYREGYAEAFERTQSRVRLAKLLPLMELSANERVVDLGCGSGLLVPFVAHRVREYLGIDFSEEFIRIANRKLKADPFANVRFLCTRVQDLADDHPGEFDVAFALDLAEHVYDVPWLEILQGARRLLRVGGRLYLHTPNADFFLERMKASNFIVRQFRSTSRSATSLRTGACSSRQASVSRVRCTSPTTTFCDWCIRCHGSPRCGRS
jgi:2-polyprenyl-3-methyl-5-hydroxy-6-metoxy-1,4-benzoquinol methylase